MLQAHAVRGLRFVEALPLLYRIAGEPKWHLGVTVNISESGVLLEAASPVAPQALIDITFQVPQSFEESTTQQMTHQGRVVRLATPTPETSYPVAIEFIDG